MEILREATSECPTLAAPQRKLEALNQPLKKPTAFYLPVILNFSPSSPAYGTICRITGSFLNAAQAF
jgi:hypothetical protein